MPLDRVPGQPLHLTVDQGADRRRHSWFTLCRSSFVLILLSILLVLVSLADGSYPDPIWIGGVYDGDDDDDVVLSFISPSPVLGGAQPRDLEALLVVVGRLPATVTTPPAVATLRAFRFRSPPIP